MQFTFMQYSGVIRETVPEDVVLAEMQRFVDDEVNEEARLYVKKFQTHTCLVERSFKGSGGVVLSKFKYGFPFGIQNEEVEDHANLCCLYIRKEMEDAHIVP